MCIIIIKPYGIDPPTAETIRSCWISNPDGAGIMYPHNGELKIEKGFMSLKALLSHLDGLTERIDVKATPIIYHLRIGTHGKNSPENTHPFPITAYPAILEKTHFAAKVAVAHNGIIPGIVPREKISDTMEYIITQLSPIREICPDFYKRPNILKMIASATRSKLAFMDSNGHIETIGSYLNVNGMLYSNASYLPASYYDNYDDAGLPYDDYTRTAYPASTYKSTYAVTPYKAPTSTSETVFLTLLDDTDGYVRFKSGNIVSAENYLINAAGLIYYYNAKGDNVVPIPNATAYSHQDCPLKMDYNRGHYFHTIPLANENKLYNRKTDPKAAATAAAAKIWNEFKEAKEAAKAAEKGATTNEDE